VIISHYKNKYLSELEYVFRITETTISPDTEAQVTQKNMQHNRMMMGTDSSYHAGAHKELNNSAMRNG